MTRYKHIIWDWNGTILDDRWLWVEGMNQLLRQRDMHEISQGEYQDTFRFPLRDYFRELGFDFQKESFDQLAFEFIRLYRARWQECDLHDNARNVLQVFANRGLSQSVLSAIEHGFLHKMIKFHGLNHFFVKLLGIGDHFAASKLENGRRHIQSLTVKQTEVLLVGDTVHDFEVAREMGVHCLLVAHGYNSRRKLQATGAEVVSSMRAVQEMVMNGDVT